MTSTAPEALATVRAYHERSKHQLQRYAAGPDTLDWDAQPDPFRRYHGAPLEPLPLAADTLTATWPAVHTPGAVPPRTPSRSAIGALFELSFGLTAWKQYGPDRWALRANPSSGNLHPTEAYLIAHGVTGLDDGLYHYAPREHALERRTRLAAGLLKDRPHLWVALSSIQWREAWKYGERAFRYCQLDAGHALGALRYAAAVLGWQARVVPGLGSAELAMLLGLNRMADYAGGAELEEPELLVQLFPTADATLQPISPLGWTSGDAWQGRANRLDARPMYRWPVIDEVAQATRTPAQSPYMSEPEAALAPARPDASAEVAQPSRTASALIRQRRSAQHFERRAAMPSSAFFRMARALLPHAEQALDLPWDVWPAAQRAARVHPVFFVHRVDGLPSGAYVLPRSAAGEQALRASMQATQWQPVHAAEHLPLFCLAEHPALAGSLRTLSCHQAIAGDACFAVSLLAEFDAPLAAGPEHYRALYQEAGLIGQALYLQAEAEGYRGTGIGCYFDDAVHELLGITGRTVQALYHFTVGVPLLDERIRTEPPYAPRVLTQESS